MYIEFVILFSDTCIKKKKLNKAFFINEDKVEVLNCSIVLPCISIPYCHNSNFKMIGARLLGKEQTKNIQPPTCPTNMTMNFNIGF